jgi:hypothetical protein
LRPWRPKRPSQGLGALGGRALGTNPASGRRPVPAAKEGYHTGLGEGKPPEGGAGAAGKRQRGPAIALEAAPEGGKGLGRKGQRAKV